MEDVPLPAETLRQGELRGLLLLIPLLHKLPEKQNHEYNIRFYELKGGKNPDAFCHVKYVESRGAGVSRVG